LLAMYPADPLQAARIACLWHGLAADHLARRQGPTAVRTTDLLQHLGPVLRADDDLLC
jgi:NAD(P)H-hydrate repair Nnr-like enzyme with NAD(P)H-hydrate dehydratase domain